MEGPPGLIIGGATGSMDRRNLTKKGII